MVDYELPTTIPQSGQLSPDQFARDPMQTDPTLLDALTAPFNLQSQFTMGRQGLDRIFLETQAGQGDLLPIEEANKEYGLNLAPTFAKQIRRGLAEDMARKEWDRQRSEFVLQQTTAPIPLSFAGGFAATLTDPLELGVGWALAAATGGIGNLAKYGSFMAKAGRLVKPSVFARFASRFPSAAEALPAAIKNPFVLGAVEGAGTQAFVSPYTYLNAEALGQEYTQGDAIMDVALAGGVTSLLAGLSHGLRGRRGTQLPYNEDMAMAQATNDFMAGRPIQLERSIDPKKNLDELQAARLQIEAELDAELNAPDAPDIPQSSPGTQLPKAAAATESAPELSSTGSPDLDFAISQAGWDAQLPADLSRSKPRYSYGKKRFQLEFESDIDKALMVVAQDTPSKRDADFMAFLRENFANLSDEDIRSLGRRLKDRIKELAKNGDPDTNPVLQVSSTRNTVADPQRTPAAAPAPKSPDVDALGPEAKQYLTQLERRLGPILDPEGQRAELTSHFELMTDNINKLAELLHLTPSKFGEALDDASALQLDIVNQLNDLNELVPVNAKLPTDLKLNNKGIFTKAALQKLGKEIQRLNDFVVSNIDDEAKITAISAEHTDLAKQLKAAYKYLAQAKTKGVGDVERWSTKINQLVPQLQHTTNLLKALGQDVETPELTLSAYMDAMGREINPELRAFLAENPSAGTDPVYRIRKQIFDNLMSRIAQTEDTLKGLDVMDLKSTVLPENSVIYKEIREYLDSNVEGAIKSEDLVNKAYEKINQEIAAYKKLDIYDETALKRFDKIDEDFKERVQKTNAIKEAALQAQICALGGASEA